MAGHFRHFNARKQRRLIALSLAVAAAFINGGCEKSTPTTGSSVLTPALPTTAQPQLPTMKLWLGADEINAELARTFSQQQTGMMFRTNMAENAGMLFPLPSTQRAAFWMKNCPLPLSVAYIDPEGVIQEIHDLQPQSTNNVISASDNIRFALETPQGWFARHQIKTGTLVRTERGSLMETFFRR